MEGFLEVMIVSKDDGVFVGFALPSGKLSPRPSRTTSRSPQSLSFTPVRSLSTPT